MPSVPIIHTRPDPATSKLWNTKPLTLLSCNIDDMTPEHVSSLFNLLFTLPILDAWSTPIQMKKGRFAQQISVLTDGHATEVIEVLFRHSTTLGVRETEVQRHSLRRSFATVDTKLTSSPKVNVKLAWLGEDCVNIKPEFEDCQRVSIESGAPVKVVSDKAIAEVIAGRAQS